VDDARRAVHLEVLILKGRVFLIEHVFESSASNFRKRVASPKYIGLLLIFVEVPPQDIAQFVTKYYEFFNLVFCDIIFLFTLLNSEDITRIYDE